MSTIEIAITTTAWFLGSLASWTVAIAGLAALGRAPIIALVGRENMPTGTPLQERYLEIPPPPPLPRIPNTWGWQ